MESFLLLLVALLVGVKHRLDVSGVVFLLHSLNFLLKRGKLLIDRAEELRLELFKKFFLIHLRLFGRWLLLLWRKRPLDPQAFREVTQELGLRVLLMVMLPQVLPVGEKLVTP